MACEHGPCQAPRVTWVEYLRSDGSISLREALCRAHADSVLLFSRPGTAREPEFPRYVYEELDAGRLTEGQVTILLEQYWKDSRR